MITLIGLGAGDLDLLSRGADRAIRDASRTGELLLRTEHHASAIALRAEGVEFETFDSLYESCPDFAAVYSKIAEAVISRNPVTYAVPGHPLIGEESSRLILEMAESLSIPVRIISSGSFIESTLSALRISMADGIDIRDALTLPLTDSLSNEGFSTEGRLNPARPILLFQVYDSASASHAKLALMRVFPDEWEVHIVRHAGISGEEELQKLPLYQLDRQPLDHLTAVYVPALTAPKRPRDFYSLVGLMSRLRAPEGCPWDREQNRMSLRKYLLEETYEALEAIESGDDDLICEELGDVLLQVVFYSQLAAEEGIFNIDDVTSHIVEKLVRRHPHVFGEVIAADSSEVLRNWERIKRGEKGYEKRSDSVLEGVPLQMPSLMRAMEMSKRAAKAGFDWPDLSGVLRKVMEELAELQAELTASDPDARRVEEELGDLFFTLVQIARKLGLDAEESLRVMLRRFEKRYRHIEQAAVAQGFSLSDLTLDQMNDLWENAKIETGSIIPP